MIANPVTIPVQFSFLDSDSDPSQKWNPDTTDTLSRASEVGSPTNPPWTPGSDKTRGQGSFGPSTGRPKWNMEYYQGVWSPSIKKIVRKML